MIFHSEALTYFDAGERKYESSNNDIILPFATKCCNFRELGNSRGYWNQSNYNFKLEFYINFPAEVFFHPNTIILFEILDFNHQALLYKDT